MIQASSTTHEIAPADALAVRVEMGSARLSLQELTDLRTGTVVTLDAQAQEGVNVFVGGELAARGEILVLEGKFCVRVTEVAAQRSTAKSVA